MAAGKHREIHVDEQKKKVVPLITREIAFGSQVCELVFSVNAFDFDLWVQVDSVK